ncbi:hypothetical protein [Ulvibacterium marinum]|uniref:Lipoprotein n=1 Tax=Ulvibacterium marinum TaxID=2419782 RepID=A0A3B0C5C9_9FLAO|nr:hypothetical protein [Ulvibacterium marinum]RKN81595.1 hypothetical protein D7Z94_11860 [Ulvibacterium marinum]
MKKIVRHITLSFFFLSCTQEKFMIGHWHEYKNQKQDFENCYIITDSTISINRFTYGGTFYLDSVDLEKVWSYSRYFDGMLPNHKLLSHSIEFENGIEWIKQPENLETFLKDFSAGYKIRIIPFEVTGEPIEQIDFNSGRLSVILALGRLKSQYENQEKGFLRSNHYFQVNDKLTSDVNELIEYVYCTHCKLDQIDLYVNMDKDTPPKHKKILDSVISILNLKPNQVFVQLADIKRMRSGYKDTSTTIYD